MKLLPIALTARRGNWNRYHARKRNKRFLAIEKKIFRRDKHTCRFCGLQIKKYLSVLNIDHNYSNNRGSNMATSCSLCAQCFFLDIVGTEENTGGKIIYLPEVSQADLNHFTRILFSSMLKDAPYKGKLQTSYLSLKDRSQIVEKLFGPGSSEPKVFGQTLIDSQPADSTDYHPALLNLRLLPERKDFKEQTLYWKSTIFEQVPL